MMFELDKETINIIEAFKTINDKQTIADILARRTVYVGMKRKSCVLKHFYENNDPDFIITSCISFGLMNFMEEDFFVVKEVLGCDYILKLLNKYV